MFYLTILTLGKHSIWRFGVLQDGTKVAETSLKVTSPFRLGLVRPQEELHPTSIQYLYISYHLQNTHRPCFITVLFINALAVCYQRTNTSSVWIEIDRNVPNAEENRGKAHFLALKIWQTRIFWSVCLQMFVNEALNHAVFYYEARSYQDIETNETIDKFFQQYFEYL